MSGPDAQLQRVRLELKGAVQGVGFRPFVFRLAVSEGLAGFVQNTVAGACLEAQGQVGDIERFLRRLDRELTPPAHIVERHLTYVESRDEGRFVIAESDCIGGEAPRVQHDLATCANCLREIHDPGDRRFGYAFTTCTHCGPRYSIIEAAPYDRSRTTMKRFPMCSQCLSEYKDPASRRFHAETNACPVCGPQLLLWDRKGSVIAGHAQQPLRHAAQALREGRILALKGLGGFQLLVDARNRAAVARLRTGKRREHKPFAVMVENIDKVRKITNVSNEESIILSGHEAPILLLHSRPDVQLIAPNVTSNPLLGIMLAYTPLHHLLLETLDFPVVATSGNLSGAPLVTDEYDALNRLGAVADVFLVHNRPIFRPVDDSVVRLVGKRTTPLRLARGYAPLTLPLTSRSTKMPVLALGGHMKTSLALLRDQELVLGPHIGDLEDSQTRKAHAAAQHSLSALYGVQPQLLACDQHPGYYVSDEAEGLGTKRIGVPHHLAHVLSGMVDNELESPVLGVAWDGSGYGSDGAIWGGEFLFIEGDTYRRAAHLADFRLPGGAAAVREPRRTAFGALYAIFGTTTKDMSDLPPVAQFSAPERAILVRMLQQAVNCPLTSSAGRLFDAVASLLGLCQRMSFEGQAAMNVEFAADNARCHYPLAPIELHEKSGMWVLDWRPMLGSLVAAWREGCPRPALAAAFHDALVDAIARTAVHLEARRVLLTGGCFQNARLTERAEQRLQAAGIDAFCHRRVPPNDGGLAVGQAAFLAYPLREVHP